jgi:hypothetical protein
MTLKSVSLKSVRLNLKEFKGDIQSGALAESTTAYVTNAKTLIRMTLSARQSRR